ncbi:MAG: hypothetical protein J3K34DRAFT_409770 [Monoraphidium minutum]|nr:MAG: hypothetical protein J3K34DRAFT_409770 [Monoraphidium minutum]
MHFCYHTRAPPAAAPCYRPLRPRIMVATALPDWNPMLSTHGEPFQALHTHVGPLAQPLDKTAGGSWCRWMWSARCLARPIRCDTHRPRALSLGVPHDDASPDAGAPPPQPSPARSTRATLLHPFPACVRWCHPPSPPRPLCWPSSLGTPPALARGLAPRAAHVDVTFVPCLLFFPSCCALTRLGGVHATAHLVCATAASESALPSASALCARTRHMFPTITVPLHGGGPATR